ncbi:hypothetical protein OQJ46_12135 [Microbulbifer thermotolerans]|uniref:Uncharacterized protein n=1 Tax=Microbulbifer thermotolerans TaxID=252514 RepID=A0AB35HZU7_MICTH|nr:hypothetical protein [Microbulbifer thermotolerans]MCX2783735.1 hypothetical protein [Microbulbifer thermotolerans]MCX2803097.1 hypothetical protein [Microbulbifer thermotolerans]WKT60429.1 hypothetical protein Q2E61_16185 [Microbulbifer thermotolerans]
MLEFNETTQNAQKLAVHYAKKLGDQLLIDFMSSSRDVTSPEEATAVIKGFWEMTDLAIEDNHNNKSVEGISDIEFWMHKLFNKVYGYMLRNGFEEQWQNISDQR